MIQKETVLLLLSGGKDSRECLKILLEQGYNVHCLCIDGIQGKERVGAQQTAKEMGVIVDIRKLSLFDEETWNPIKLIIRDLLMGIVAIKTAKKIGAKQIATGVKLADLDDPDLKWLPGFLQFAAKALGIFGVKLIFPVWDAAASDKTQEKEKHVKVKKKGLIAKTKNKLFYFIVSNLPTKIRHAFYRKQFARVPTSVPEGLTFELAKSQDDLEAAFKLLHNAYVEQGFIEPQPTGMRFIVQHALPTTSILVAKLNGQVVGTLSVMRDTALGLPMEKVFDISHLKKDGRRVAEFSSLAIHPDFRRNMGGDIFFPLTLYASNFAKRSFGTDYLVFNLYPHHADFYNAIFGSSHLQGQKDASIDYMGAPATGIQLDLVAVVDFAIKKYAGLPPDRDLHAYTFVTVHDHCKFPVTSFGEINHPVMTPEIFKYFFLEKTDLLKKSNALERIVLNHYYPLEQYAKIIPFVKKTTGMQPRIHDRWDSHIKGQCLFAPGSKESSCNITILDLSISGFRAYVDRELSINISQEFQVLLSNGELAIMTATPVWKIENQGVYGFKITKSNSIWDELVEIHSRKLTSIAS